MTFFQTPPALGNPYLDDSLLRSFLRHHLPPDVLAEIEPSLTHMGELAVGPMLERSMAHRTDEPRHVPYDAWGRRVDEVTVTPAWQEYARIAASEGVVATAYERRHGAHSRVHQFALAYLFGPSSQTYTCPLAMTDGCARTLEMLGAPALQDEILPRLLSRDPQDAWTSGQWMTERTGGSDVGLSETIARRDGDTWRLWGTKWFTSAVNSEVALTLARPEGNGPGGRGLALFFVKLRDAEGHLQGIQVNRLKEKLGTRNLPTAELTLAGTPAIPVAGLEEGVRNMRFMLNLTRTWNAVSAVSGMQRGLAWCRAYATQRVAFGAPLAEKPLHLDTLAGLAAEIEAGFALTFHVVRLLGREETGGSNERDTGLLRVLTPLMKLLTAKQAVYVAQEVIEAFGGAGYVEDTGLPALFRDAQVLPIWEGTTNVLALESFRALQRTDGLRPLVEWVQATARCGTAPELRGPVEAAIRGVEHAAAWLTEAARDPQRLEAGARRCAMTLARAAALALLVEHAQWAIEARQGRSALLAAQRWVAQGVDLVSEEASYADARSLALGLADV